MGKRAITSTYIVARLVLPEMKLSTEDLGWNNQQEEKMQP